MKKMFWVALAALLTLGAAQAQSVKSESVADFVSVNFSGKISVELIPGNENKVDITLQDTDATKLEWGVTGGVLTIKLKPNGLTSKVEGSAVAKVMYKSSLMSMTLNGAEVITKGTWKGDLLSVDISGGAKLTADVDCRDIDVKATGNSIAQLAGKTKYLVLRATMRSKVDARKLQSMNAEVSAVTNSEVYVFSDERLVADANSASTIFYLGQPSILKRSEKMGGNVYSIDALPGK